MMAPAPQNASDRDDFARLLVDELRREIDPTAEYDPAGFRILCRSLHVTMNLDRAYAEYLAAAPGARADILRRWARSVQDSDVPDSLEQAAPNLTPRVVSRSFLELSKLQMELDHSSSVDTPHQVLADHLLLALACHGRNAAAFVFVTQRHLERWGASFDQALQIALANLQAATPEPPRRIAPGLYASPWKDNCDASRLALGDWVGKAPVKGDPVVAVPNRDTLLIAGSEDPEGLRAMLDHLPGAIQNPYALSGVPVTLCERRWLAYEPEDRDGLTRGFRTQRLESQEREYDAQEKVLRQIHQKKGSKSFIAEYMVFTNETTGESLSACSWTRLVVSLLPKAEFISFVDLDRPTGKTVVARAPWERALQVVGGLMKPVPGLYPRRWLVESFPSDDQLKLLAKPG